MIRIGSWLKTQRQAAGKSQLESSMETYVSIDTIRKIEQNTIYPRTNHFEKLCRFFGVSPGDYYRDTESPTESLPPPNRAKTTPRKKHTSN